MSDFTLNPMANVYANIIEIINNITIKYSYLAETYETKEMRQDADDYIDAMKKRDVYESHLDYIAEDYYSSSILVAQPNAPQLISEAILSNDPEAIPASLTMEIGGKIVSARDQILNARRQRVIDAYEEKNDYYRMLMGYPPIGMIKYRYIYVPEEICNVFGWDYEEMKNVPIHKIQDYYNAKEPGLGNQYISKIAGYGYLNQLITRAALDEYNRVNNTEVSVAEWEDMVKKGEVVEYEWLAKTQKNYLRYIGAQRIDLITAREANNFAILKLPLGNIKYIIHANFLTIYEQCREYYVKAIYIRDMRYIIDYYDKFSALCIMVMSIQQLVASQLKLVVNREFFDVYAVRMLYQAYGVPYDIYLDEDTQKRIVQNLNLFIQNKATNKGLYNIAEVLGFGSNFSIYKYYLSKQHKFDAYGVPLFRKTTRFNNDTGEVDIIPDYEYEYDLYFHTAELRDDNFINTFNSNLNHVNYKDITVPDPYWYEDTNLYRMVWESEYNFVESKYLGISIAYSLTDMMFDNILLLKSIISRNDQLSDIMITLPKITGTLEVPIFDIVILLICLMACKHNLTGEIISIPTQIINVMDYMANVEDDNDNPFLVDTFAFDFEYLLRKNWEYCDRQVKGALRVVHDDFEPFDETKMIRISDARQDIPDITLYNYTTPTDELGYLIIPDDPNEEYIEPQPKPDMYYNWFIGRLTIDPTDIKAFLLCKDRKLLIRGKITVDPYDGLNYYLDEDAMSIIGKLVDDEDDIDNFFIKEKGNWVIGVITEDITDGIGFYLDTMPLRIVGPIDTNPDDGWAFYLNTETPFYVSAPLTDDCVLNYFYTREVDNGLDRSIEEYPKPRNEVYVRKPVNLVFPESKKRDPITFDIDYDMVVTPIDEFIEPEKIIEIIPSSSYVDYLPDAYNTIEEWRIAQEMPWIRNYKIVSEPGENTLEVVDDLAKDFNPRTQIKYSVIRRLYKGVAIGDYLAHSMAKTPTYVTDRYVYVVDQLTRVKQLIGEEDAEKLSKYISVLSFNSYASTEDKIKAFNDMYENVKKLHKLLDYLMTETRDRKVYDHLRRFYDAVFYEREVRDTFTIKDKDTGDDLRTAFNYFEYLHQLNPLLYNAVFEFDMEDQYRLYLSLESQYKKYLEDHNLTEEQLTFSKYKDKVADGEIVPLDSNTYPYSEFETDVNLGNIKLHYDILKDSIIDNASVKDERIYFLVNHCVSRLKELIRDIKYLYMLGDSVTPLEDLLMKLIRYFKSYTVDIVSLDNVIIIDLKPENIVRLFDEVRLSKVIEKHEHIHLPFSDNAALQIYEYLFDRTLHFKEKFVNDIWLILDNRNSYSMVDYNYFQNDNPDYKRKLMILKRKLDSETYNTILEYLEEMRKYDPYMTIDEITRLNQKTREFYRFLRELEKNTDDNAVLISLRAFLRQYSESIYMVEDPKIISDINIDEKLRLSYSDNAHIDNEIYHKEKLGFRDKVIITYDDSE